MHRFWIVSLLVATAFAWAPPTRAAVRGDVSGKTVDVDGKSIRGITVRFVPQTGEARETTTNKKGRFFQRDLPAGGFRVQVGDAQRFVTKLEYELKNADGLTVGQGSMDGHPKLGAGPVPYTGRSDVSLTLVIADRQSEEAYDRVLAFAAPELNALVDLYQNEEFSKVVEGAKTILADDPELAEAHYMLGIALKRSGDLDGARRSLEQAVVGIPDYPGIWRLLGDANLDLAGELEQAGDGEAAAEAYARGAEALGQELDRGNETPGMLVDLAAALERLGAHERLAAVLIRILELEPDNLQARLRLASIHSAAGQDERALELLQGIPETEKRAAVTIYNTAVGLNEAGNVDGALAAARRAAEIDPDLPQPQQLLVQIHLARGERPQAAAAIRRFLELSPDDPIAGTYRKILDQIAAE